MRQLIIIATLLFSQLALSIEFDEAMKRIETHESVDEINAYALSLKGKGEVESSWGDPKFKIAAKNFPKDTLKNDQTPMTGVEFGLSQKISLTNKSSKINNSYSYLSKSMTDNAKDKLKSMQRLLWEVLIQRKKVTNEVSILNENLRWIEKILKVSKKLYVNGKTSQQAILEIQIRKSEIEREIISKKYQLSSFEDKLYYLVGDKNVETKSIPWKILNKKSDKNLDHKENALKAVVSAREYKLKASKLNYIPDVTVSLGYTKRANIDGQGDFVGAQVSFPLPFSDTTYAKNDQSVHEKFQAVRKLENFKRMKRRDVSIHKKEIERLESELKTINNKTIKFAKNSRSITSKSYGLGNSSYVELLQSELKLQQILMLKVNLQAKRDTHKSTLKYVLGESLNE